MEATNELKSDAKLMLVTANVGSLFEDPKRLLSIWLEEFIAKVTEISPQFLALHLQEVGGKTYEKSMEHVQEFIKNLCDAMYANDYKYVCIYMDEDFKSAEHFTALGNIYFGHTDLCTLKIWNFLSHEWEDKTCENKQIFSGNIEQIPTKEKSKFPQHFFPECKWSRKGFMRTRWEINGTAIDLINIHLFHDASNLAACENFPSVYCKTRRRALVHTIERFHLDAKNGFVPFFLFGDFNFRCDTAGVVKELTENLNVHRIQSLKTESTKIHYRNSIGNNILTVGRKEFSHADHQLKFKEYWLKKFDRELEPLSEILFEYPINFIPSYPFEEDPEMPTDYMSTRCPSWCDRILMTPQVQDIIQSNDWKYDMIGESACMGDHKPIYLSVCLKPKQGTYKSCDCSCIYTHANNNNNVTSSVQCVSCPYSNKLYKEIVNENNNLKRVAMLEDSSILFSRGNKNESTWNSSNKANATKLATTLSEYEKDSTENYSRSIPNIRINIIDSENMCECRCLPESIPETCVANERSIETRRIICQMCHDNIVKSRCSLLSNSMTESIIVNQIDTQHLNAYMENLHVDPYTPESIDSHSPNLELRSTFLNISNESCNTFSADRTRNMDDFSHDHKKHLPLKSGNDNLKSASSVEDLAEKQSRTTVTPVQLKSRLENLQRISDKDGITVVEDVNSVEDICSSKPIANRQHRNPCILSMCCSSASQLNLAKTQNSLKTLMTQSMVDESLWIEQSNTDDTGVSQSPVSRYILVKSISPSLDAEQESCPSKLEADSGPLLKETSV
ncbi:hypothetical protein KR222_001772 [Zaprionus bogoriensis]|nr:hypothetical protein KR222_001772 [Zaprionus bogoriensis]